MNLQISSLMAAALCGNVRALDNLNFDEVRQMRRWKERFIQQHGQGSFWLYSNNDFTKCVITGRRTMCANVEFLNCQAPSGNNKSAGGLTSDT